MQTVVEVSQQLGASILIRIGDRYLVIDIIFDDYEEYLEFPSVVEELSQRISEEYRFL